ncbi:unnamed protein product [Fraxinus pennsylvanica]|uniref:Uncharacterized protein n=1 Tax=Fraxinus pennsylvanica TaxID=56036 RepID=A0AAD2ACE6_9LAMI|nr:unnamed protein product [Fraxinus pennsylvanica]
MAGAAEEELKLEADDFKFKVEGIVKQLAVAGDHDKITAVINLLTTEFTYSAEANHRKLFQRYWRSTHLNEELEAAANNHNHNGPTGETELSVEASPSPMLEVSEV